MKGWGWGGQGRKNRVQYIEKKQGGNEEKAIKNKPNNSGPVRPLSCCCFALLCFCDFDILIGLKDFNTLCPGFFVMYQNRVQGELMGMSPLLPFKAIPCNQHMCVSACLAASPLPFAPQRP